MELLAPAGNLNTFYLAVGGGANAVYLGLKDFSARKSAENFSYEELETALKFARVMGVKIYVALNTLVKENELDDFLACVSKLRSMGVDAIILQDLFLGKFLSEKYPDLELHLSTQGGVNNLEGALVAKEFGFKRVILARETPIQEIKKITAVIETEVFIQGALCTSFSGHCYMSSFGGGNSGNRGLCKQPCRRTYSLGGGEENYAICTADLSVGERILELKDIGVTSFKIEGRMRRGEYVVASLNYYRSILYPYEKVGGEFSDLKRTYNRGDYTGGLQWGQDRSFLSTLSQGHIGEKVGVVKKVMGSKIYVNGSLNPVKGDCFKVLRSGVEVGSAESSGERASQGFTLNSKGKIRVGDAVYITTDVRLNGKLLDVISVRMLDLNFEVSAGERAKATLYADGKVVAFLESEEPLPLATGAPLTEGQVKEIFNKVDNYPFHIENFVINIVGAPFGARSVLNGLRRNLYALAYENLSFRPTPLEEKVSYEHKEYKIPPKTIALISESFEALSNYDIAIYAPSDYNDERYLQKFFTNTTSARERYLYVPSLLNSKDKEIIKRIVVDFDGIYGENPHLFALAREWNKKIFIGTDFNLFNSLSMGVAFESADYVSCSKELTQKEILRTGYLDNLFTFTRGDIKVMELGYCPYQKNCAQCKAPTISTLTDYASRKFTLRRIKLSKCYFEVYNPMELVYDDANLSVYNFVLHKGKELSKRIECSVKEYREKVGNTTSGHLKNPVE